MHHKVPERRLLAQAEIATNEDLDDTLIDVLRAQGDDEGVARVEARRKKHRKSLKKTKSITAIVRRRCYHRRVVLTELFAPPEKTDAERVQ